MPKYTIIIPTYNDALKILRSVRSVIDQTFGDWELIIVDDGSTDDTSKVIQPFLENSRINYIKKKNGGVASARNVGAKNSSGEYLVFLDSDDEFKSELLRDYDARIKYESNIGLISCGVLIGDKEKLPRIQKGISKFKYSVLAGSFCIKREIFNKIGGYDVELRQSENWEMMARALNFCEIYNLKVEYINKCNLLYHHFADYSKVIGRDRNRAIAMEHLYEKYKDGGVLNFKCNDFLIAAAVNYTRVGEIRKARTIFYKIFRDNPKVSNLLRIVIFELPYLRNKKWVRNNYNPN
jgi:glycosyltransferase involved in cell wall biosynthesis